MEVMYSNDNAITKEITAPCNKNSLKLLRKKRCFENKKCRVLCLWEQDRFFFPWIENAKTCKKSDYKVIRWCGQYEWGEIRSGSNCY